MNVSVIGGSDHKGLINAVGLAVHGHKVIYTDLDPNRVKLISSGILTFNEEGFEEMLSRAKAGNNIVFTHSFFTTVTQSDIIIVTVSTSESKLGNTDISQLLRALKSISLYLDGYRVIVIKSTIPPGTCNMVSNFLENNTRSKKASFDIVYNPENLADGTALMDFMNPDKIIIGADSKKSEEFMKELYSYFDCPIVITDIKNAENTQNITSFFSSL